MAKKTTRKTKPTPIAIVRAALKRALSQVEAKAKKDNLSLELQEGSYPVALEIGIDGDVTVAAPPRPMDPVEKLAVPDNSVMIGVLAQMDRKAQRSMISKSIKLNLRAGKNDRAAEQMAAALDAFNELKIAEGRKLDQVSTWAPSPSKQGAISGKPSVTITGASETRALNVEVKAA